MIRCSLYCAKACNEFVLPTFKLLRLLATQLFSKKCCRVSKLLAIPCPICPAQGFNLRPPVSGSNALPLDQLAGNMFSQLIPCNAVFCSANLRIMMLQIKSNPVDCIFRLDWALKVQIHPYWRQNYIQRQEYMLRCAPKFYQPY